MYIYIYIYIYTAVKIIEKTEFNKPVEREGFWAYSHAFITYKIYFRLKFLNNEN